MNFLFASLLISIVNSFFVGLYIDTSFLNHYRWHDPRKTWRFHSILQGFLYSSASCILKDSLRKYKNAFSSSSLLNMRFKFLWKHLVCQMSAIYCKILFPLCCNSAQFSGLEEKPTHTTKLVPGFWLSQIICSHPWLAQRRQWRLHSEQIVQYHRVQSIKKEKIIVWAEFEEQN